MTKRAPGDIRIPLFEVPGFPRTRSMPYGLCAPDQTPQEAFASKPSDTMMPGIGSAASTAVADAFFMERLLAAIMLAKTVKPPGSVVRVGAGDIRSIYTNNQDTVAVVHVRVTMPTNSVAPTSPVVFIGLNSLSVNRDQGNVVQAPNAVAALLTDQTDVQLVQPGESLVAYLRASAGTEAWVQVGAATIRAYYTIVKRTEDQILEIHGR